MTWLRLHLTIRAIMGNWNVSGLLPFCARSAGVYMDFQEKQTRG